MELFGSLNVLMALLVSSWRLPVPIWSQNRPEIALEVFQKVFRN